MSDFDEELEERSGKALGLFWGVLSLLAPPVGFVVGVVVITQTSLRYDNYSVLPFYIPFAGAGLSGILGMVAAVLSRSRLGRWSYLSVIAFTLNLLIVVPVLGFFPLLKNQLFPLRIHTPASSATIPSTGAPGSGIGSTSASVVP